jgi:hypothetical protein
MQAKLGDSADTKNPIPIRTGKMEAPGSGLLEDELWEVTESMQSHHPPGQVLGMAVWTPGE